MNPAHEVTSDSPESTPSQSSEIQTDLLNKYFGKEDYLLVQKTRMGGGEGYLGSVTLEWLESRVKFASQLPLFRHKFDPKTQNVIRDQETIDEIQQRPLDWSRQAPLAQYLALRKSHKFPPLLVVQSPPWVDNPQAKEWDENGKARQSSVNFIPLEKTENLGFLNLKDVAIFVVDGQHRLMGIQGLISLLKTGELQAYNKQKKPVGQPMTIDQLLKDYQIEFSTLQNLAQEKIGIELIPAVIQGESHQEARWRVRSIFVHVNLMAIKLTQGQLALLNEDDGFSIVARKVAVIHPLLKAIPDRNPRVNWDSGTVSTHSPVLTTLQTLQEMSERYLKHKFPHWFPSEKGLIAIRPEEEELESGIDLFSQVWDGLENFPSYQRIEQGEDPVKLRKFSWEKGGGEGNILFRPVGQIALAQALGWLVFKRGFSLTNLLTKLAQYDQDGGFKNMEFSDSLWYGVLYAPNQKRILVSGRDLAAKLIIYILGGIEDDFERAQLRQNLADVRTIEGKAISFTGKFVPPREVGLPPILS